MKIAITESMIEEAIKYAEEGHEFLIRRMGESVKEHKRRLFVGHLTELIGNECLTMRGYNFKYPIRYIVKERGVDDRGDFFVQTTSGETLVFDAKSASKSFHYMIIVPYDQYEKKNVDIYLGIRLYSWNESETSIYPTFDKSAKVCGWAYHHEFNLPNERSSSGGIAGYWVELESLYSLTELDKLIRPQAVVDGWLR